MRIIVHDFAGHPFQIQLSRELAKRGHHVLHLYSRSIVTPRGALDSQPDDPRQLAIRGISLPSVIDKSSYLKRFLLERKYGRLLAAEIRSYRPDAVVSANTPLDAQSMALKAAHGTNARFVFWLQDIYSVAITSLLSRKLGWPGRTAGSHYSRVEGRLLRRADAVVAISEDFVSVLGQWRVPREKITVIPNWASTEEIPTVPKSNPWSRLHELDECFCFIYSGTLGMKHDPELIVQLGVQLDNIENARVVVVSEGAGADFIRERSLELGLRNVEVMAYQPYADLAYVLGAADVLVAILDREASVFSVPSKVLSYLCAGRPLLLAVPADNLAAKVVRSAGAGLVVDPGDSTGFAAGGDYLVCHPDIRQEMGARGLSYARDTFDIGSICDRFESVLLT